MSVNKITRCIALATPSITSGLTSDLYSTSELNDAVKSGVSVIWIYDSDGANVGFGKKYEG